MKQRILWRLISEYSVYILLAWVIAYEAVRICSLWLESRKVAGTCRISDRFLFYQFFILSAVVYCVLLLYITLFGREPGTELRYNLNFLWEYRLAFSVVGGSIMIENRVWFWQIVNNVLLFVPLGVLYSEWVGLHRHFHGALRWYQALLAGFVVSFSIELTQLVFHLGLFEFDDMLNNCIGMMAGWSVWKISDVFTELLINKGSRSFV